MNISLYDLETDMTGGDYAGDAGSTVTDSGDAAAGADTSTIDGGAAPDVNDAAPATAPTPTFDPNQLGEYVGSAVQQQLAPLLNALTPQPETPSFELDPFADNFGDQIQGLLGHQVQQLLAPYLPAIQAAQDAQVSQWVDQNLNQAMSTYKAPDGTDGDRNAVLYAAAGFRAQTGDDAQAITAARDYMVQHDADIAAKAVETYKRSISNDNPAQRDPGVNGAAVGIEPAAKSYADILNRWETRTAA